MHITFSPIRSGETLTLSKVGDVLTGNGVSLDLTDIPDGATLPRTAIDCDWIASDVERVDGELHLTVFLPHGANAPEKTRFPQPIIATDGGIDVPAHSLPEPDLETEDAE